MQVPPLFWWEGPDGSRVLTAYSPEYGTPLMPPANWPYKTWLAMIMTGDNQGPPTPQQVNDIRTKVAKELPGVKVKFGKLEDFSDAIAGGAQRAHPRRPRRHARHVDPRLRGDADRDENGLQRPAGKQWSLRWTRT